ncbi:MAG: class I SAM-dependent methyltransferase [Thermoleophilaceae bacterium]
MTRHFAKLCDVRDWDDAELLRTIAEILPERDPATHVERKAWEFAMLALFLQDSGRMNEQTDALALGAGDERIVFWLANRLGRVVATDIYGEGDFAGREAAPSMLEDPAAHAPFPYREDRLEVRWMDARRLEFPDESFDVVFSLSSFEHFGGRDDVAAAARELGRVLRPGGHAFVVTECFVHRHPLNAAPVDLAVKLLTLGRKRRRAGLRSRAVVVEVFTPRELERLIVAPSGLELMQPLDVWLPRERRVNVTRTDRHGLHPESGDYWPHVLLKADRSLFTSVALPLRKPV